MKFLILFKAKKLTEDYLKSNDNTTKYSKLEAIPIPILYEIINKLKLFENIPDPEDINEKLTQIKYLSRILLIFFVEN